jgi:predicted deacetylase
MTTVERWLLPLVAALDDAPEPVDVFLRDDDAGWGDDRLFELLDLTGGLGLPLDVAVIPEALDAAAAAELRRRVADRPALVGLHQHGYAHANHEPEGRKQEFGPARSAQQQHADIAAGRERLQELLGDALEPVFTPPWNRCTADTAAAVRDLGFEVLSREARAPRFDLDGLRELPVSIDWFAKRHGERLTRDALGELAGARVRKGEPVGVMLHHAVMDADELRAVAPLLTLLAGHERVRRRRLLPLARERG